MPRVFAHAHLAALDTFLSLFWTLALLAGDRALRSQRPVLAMAGAGVFWALALLTKIHAWFLLPILGVWSFVWLSPRRAVSAMLAWAVVGISLFWLGWPWLWYDSWNRLQAFWGTGVARSTIMVQYFGQVVADRDVPWHYPWFYFAATVPVGLLALGAVGIVRGWKNRRADPFPLLLAGTIVVFLVIFSTRVPVYDGERLFLHVFPAWAILIGLGFGWLWEHASHQSSAPCRAGWSSWSFSVYGVDRAPPIRAQLLQWVGRRTTGSRTAGTGADLLERPGRSGAARPAGARRESRCVGRSGPHALSRSGNPDNQSRAGTAEHHPERRTRGAPEPSGSSSRVAPRTGAPRSRNDSVAETGQQVAMRTRQGVWLAALWHFPPPNTAHPPGDSGASADTTVTRRGRKLEY